MRQRILCVALISLLSVLGAAADDYMLVAPITPPGNAPPSQWGGVMRFTFLGTGPLTPLSSIPADLVSDPVSATFSASGELFVGNRHGNVGGGSGSISRFTFDGVGGFAANGTITGNGLEAVHGIDFSGSGELFAASVLTGTVSRFNFNGAGAAIPNGMFSTAPLTQGLAFSPSGELFLPIDDEVRRFQFDGNGQAIPNGSFVVPGANALLFLDFSPQGELFVPDPTTGLIHRYEFDGNGSPVANGAISVPGAGSVAFSPLGELFVSSNDETLGGIYRFVFDGEGNAISNGFVAGFPFGSIAIIPEPATLSLLMFSGLVVLRRR